MSPSAAVVSTHVQDLSNNVIVVNDFRQSYGNFVAIKGLSLTIKSGEIFGLIGPDGAGKTSTFNVLGGVMEATSGSITVLAQTPRQARNKIGYLTQQFSLHLDLSVQENIEYSAGIREISKEVYYARNEQYLKSMDLYRFRDRLAGQLSGGMKQKLALCCALVSAPEVLLLDEPTTGVDPVSRREFWDILAAVAADGVTIAVATPYLDEAERCTRVALIYDGIISDIGTPKALIQNMQMHRLEVRCEDLEKLELELRTLVGKSAEIFDVQEFGDRLDVLTANSDIGSSVIFAKANELNLSKPLIEVSEPNLENVFVSRLRDNKKEIGEFKQFSFRPNEALKKDIVAIGAEDISMSFGDFQAVKKVSLQVKYGEIFGLLGANGAGKTTTIKMLCGLLTPSDGTMTLAGAQSNLRSSELRKRIGYMSQKFTLYDDLTVLENLKFYCGVYEVSKNVRRDKIEWVLNTCGLRGQENLLTKSLPEGWKKRLAFGACVMHQPEILFLDEPTSGVDPLARRQLWRLIRQFARNGTAVLVTTHFLEEAEHCQKLAFMVAGEIVAQGSPSQIKKDQPGKIFEITTNNNQKSAQIIRANLEAWRVAIFADSLHVNLDNPENELPNLKERLKTSGVQIYGIRTIPTSLEDAFIGIVQRANGRQS